MFLVSQIKLVKLAAKFTTKAKSTYNKALDQTTSTCTSLFSSFTPLEDKSASDSYYVANNFSSMKAEIGGGGIGEETYDLERIKMEEMSSRNSLNPANTSSRCKKVYKSFKSAIRRNSSASNSSSTSSMNGATTNKCLAGYSTANLNDFDSQKSSLTNSDATFSAKLNSKELNVFQNEYGYDEYGSSKLCDYDHSVYPYAKTHSSSSTLTKTSKKVF